MVGVIFSKYTRGHSHIDFLAKKLRKIVAVLLAPVQFCRFTLKLCLFVYLARELLLPHLGNVSQS